MQNQKGVISPILLILLVIGLVGGGIYFLQTHPDFFKKKVSAGRPFTLQLPSSTPFPFRPFSTAQPTTPSPTPLTSLSPSPATPTPTPSCVPKSDESTTISVAGQTEPNLTLSPSSLALKPKANFSINVRSTIQNLKIDGVDIILNYNPNQLELISVSPKNPNLGYGAVFGTNDGKIVLAGAPLYGVDETLTTISFKVKDSFTSGKAYIKFEFNPDDPKNTKDSNIVENTSAEEKLVSVRSGVYLVDTNACN